MEGAVGTPNFTAEVDASAGLWDPGRETVLPGLCLHRYQSRTGFGYIPLVLESRGTGAGRGTQQVGVCPSLSFQAWHSPGP